MSRMPGEDMDNNDSGEIEAAGSPAMKIAGVTILVGFVVCWLLLSLIALTGDLALVGFDFSVGVIGLYWTLFQFIPADAPLLATAFWGAAHGIPVGIQTPVGVLQLHTVYRVNHLFAYIPPVLLAIAGAVGALVTRTRLIVVPVVSWAVIIVSYITYMIGGLLVIALVTNHILVPLRALYTHLLIGDVPLLWTRIIYPSPLKMVGPIVRTSAPAVGAGVAIGTALRALKRFLTVANRWLLE